MKYVNLAIVFMLCLFEFHCVDENSNPASTMRLVPKHGFPTFADTVVVPPDSTVVPDSSIVPDSSLVPPDSIPPVPEVVMDTTILYRCGGFGALKQFHNIPNSSDSIITIYSSSYNVNLYFGDGSSIASLYISPTGGSDPDGVTNLKLTKYVYDDYYGWTGHYVPSDTLLLNTVYSSRRVYVRSGRGQHWSTLWTLEGGSIIRPRL